MSRGRVSLFLPEGEHRPCGQTRRESANLRHPGEMDLPTELQELGPVFTKATALGAGLSAYWLDRASARGVVDRLAPGVFRLPVALEDGEPWRVLHSDHLQRCREAQAVHPGHVISHQSAAVLHGLQLRLHPAMNVHLTSVDRAPCSRRRDGLELHHADSVTNGVVVVDGLRVTTLARTIADILRTSRMPHSVALLDAAVRDRLVTVRAVRSEVDQQVRWRGRPRALAALDLVDPRRESWLESYSFIALHELGVPLPRPQVDVLDAGFHFVGRVDGLLGGVFLESDGASKYRLLAEELGITPEDSIARTMAAQVDRQERLERLGLRCTRWTTSEILRQPELVCNRVWQELNAADPKDFKGWLRIDGKLVKPKPLTHRP